MNTSTTTPAPQAGKIFTRDFVLGAAINFLVYLNYFVLMVTTTSFCMATYNSDAAISGLAASIFIIGAIVGRLATGAVMENIGRKRVLFISTLAIALLSACYLLPVSLGVLIAIRTVHGICYGAAQSTVTVVVTDIVPSEHKGEGIGYYMLSGTVGAAIGPLIGLFLEEHAGYEALFAFTTAIGVLSVLASLVIRVAHQPKARSLNLSIDTFVERKALPISAVAALIYMAYGSIVTYLSAFAAGAGLTTAAEFFFMVYSIVMMATRPATGKLLDRQGDLPVMCIGFVAFIVGMIAMSQAYNGAVLLIAAALCGIGIGSAQPTGLTLAIKASPLERMAVANSTYFVALDVAIGVVPILFGWTIALIDYRGMFLLMAGILVLACVLYAVCRKKKWL